ncbi:MAG: DUF368 domain-containing protein, partial [Ketobacteraceae bacterium]|nr:DUF368 domain-containing protein [Ketobacteraceae bacterium]
WNLSKAAGLLIGAAAAWQLSGLSPTEVAATPLIIFFSGALAICAMILPGVSGSFILLMLGMYSQVLGAIKSLDFVTMGIFGAGCVIGLLSFSRVLNWLLKHYHEMTMAVLTGRMLGSLNKVWPWKQTLSYRVNSKGEQVPLLQENLSPAAFADLTGQEPQVMAATGLMLLAILLVLGLEWVALRGKKIKD